MEIKVKDIINICNGKLIIGDENIVCDNFSKDTVRGAAKKFGISKSTVHTERSELQKSIIPKYIELPNVSKDSMPVRVTIAVRM